MLCTSCIFKNNVIDTDQLGHDHYPYILVLKIYIFLNVHSLLQMYDDIVVFSTLVASGYMYPSGLHMYMIIE